MDCRPLVCTLVFGLTCAGPILADTSGSDMAAMSSAQVIDSDGVHPAGNNNCDFGGNPLWCGQGPKSSSTARSSATGEATLGLINGHIEVSNELSSNGNRWRSSAQTLGGWFDTFSTVADGGLLAGTPITVKLHVDLEVPLFLSSILSAGLSTPANVGASIHLGGGDGVFLTGLNITSEGVFSSESIVTDMFTLGSDFVLAGVFDVRMETDGISLPNDMGAATGIAHYYVDILTPGVTLSAASSHDYSTPVTAMVPEPETYAMLLAGLGFLGFAARRRKQKELAA